MGDDLLPELGDLVISVLISYAGALEFMYVVRHLYHWSCGHTVSAEHSAKNLKQLQDHMRSELAQATEKEQRAGTNVMQDGMLYKDGFRIDPQENKQASPSAKEQRRKEIEAELARQKQIEEQTRKELERAEAELIRQRAEEEENIRKLLEAERKREEEERNREMAEMEAGRKREEEERKAEESARKQRQAEEKRIAKEEEEERLIKEHEENERKLRQSERQREEEQEQREMAEAEAAARKREEEDRIALLDSQRILGEKQEMNEIFEKEATKDITASTPREAEELRVEECLRQLLDAESDRQLRQEEQEQERSLIEAELEFEKKQRLIEENARKFLEADQEMEELQHRMLEAAQQQPIQQRRLSATESAPQTPVFEEPCIRKTVSPLFDDTSAGSSERLTHTVKTQFGQTSNEPYSVTTKPLLFKSISDDTSSIEPPSTLSTQHSEEVFPGADDTAFDAQFTQQERQEPEGDDNDKTASQQYTDDYLRSLDGIKHRPLIREDGSGRRRAFKMRRSSGSSNSSRGSREEEVKMFTSLEQEELENKKEGEGDFTPIKYTTEPLLKVKGHRRRHKRSPAKDINPSDGSLRNSLEMLDEENINPWGEMPPEHYKDTPFWKREKSMSIDEEDFEFEKPTVQHEVKNDNEVTNVPKTSSFEDATHIQNEEALSTLQRKQVREEPEETKNEAKLEQEDSARSDTNPNLQTNQQIGATENSGRSSASPRLRRSPRIDEMDHYEERWTGATEGTPSVPAAAETVTTPSTPSIVIHDAVDNAPWRDQHGLIMEGLSDFYDFTASVNPSRSRSASRQPSPASTQPNTPTTENVAFIRSSPNETRESESIVDVYDDTGTLMPGEVTKQNIVNFIESLQDDCTELSQILVVADRLQNVVNTPNNSEKDSTEHAPDEMNLLVQRLRVERGRSRSRSRSPLPTSDNLERSLESRRNKLIKHNDEVFEKLGVDATELLNRSEEEESGDSMNALVAPLRLDRTKSTSDSRSPLSEPTSSKQGLKNRRLKNEKLKLDLDTSNEFQTFVDDASPDDEMVTNQEYLIGEKSHARSRSRSRSPLPTPANLQRSLETRRNKLIQQNDALFEKINVSPTTSDESSQKNVTTSKPITPIISVQCCDDQEMAIDETVDSSREEVISLIESLRMRRSRSKSPLRRMEREKTPEPFSDIYSTRDNSEEEREIRSRTPSRSSSMSPSRLVRQNAEQHDDFHTMLNLEASDNKTLLKATEERETILAEKQRAVDLEALRKLSTASEEVELRTITPVDAYNSKLELEGEEADRLSVMPITERMRLLRCSPTTPDYDRTISSEWRDVQRIKEEMISSGFKRSTYVGESLDLGSEFEPLRQAAARFQRSRSPSPSYIDTDQAKRNAAENLEVQEQILSELITASEKVSEVDRLGAKPKEIPSQSREMPESQYAEMRRINAEFQRSRSQSRSPLGDHESEEVAKIEAAAVKRELQDKMLDDIQKTSVNFQEFSRYLNAGFLDNERRASDSALIQKPEVLIQFQDLEVDLDMDPEDYHHFRRFSLNQEQSVEEYPNDDCVYVSQIEVQTPNGTRTWIREDYYSQDFDKLNIISEESAAVEVQDSGEEVEEQVRGEEDETDGSEDERQTVVEVEDEIDEDICDFNERGPADESHHETSECEEAEREMDRYADRDFNDWLEVENIDKLLDDESNLSEAAEGAVGGFGTVDATLYDSDSVAIDEIYDEAIKNRKQSGILRDYDSILKEMQRNYVENSNTDSSEADTAAKGGKDNYAVWAKARELDKKQRTGMKGVENSLQLIENERREAEVRYLGDANIDARQSTRLRSRYGYVPLLHGNAIDGDLDVDLNYKPKKEYNWRKNFRIEDEDNEKEQAVNIEQYRVDQQANKEDIDNESDWRKFSLGGESITLFSRSPEKDLTSDCIMPERAAEREMMIHERVEAGKVDEMSIDKPKKKKSKKKLRKDTIKESFEHYDRDEDDSENQIYSRRSSSIQMETDSPKRKSRSRRGSRSSTAKEDAINGVFSPSNSIDNADGVTDTKYDAAAMSKKKTKKRKKPSKEIFVTGPDIQEEHTSEMFEKLLEVDMNLAKCVMTASAAITPNTAGINPLATISPQNSVCVTPGSIDSETGEKIDTVTEDNEESTPLTEVAAAAISVATRTATTTTTTTRTIVDTFDILKDANFYPLF